MKRIPTIILFFALCLLLSRLATAFPCLIKPGLRPNEIASLLGWFPTCTNLCGGYYKEPAIVLSCTSPGDINASTTTITAERTLSFAAAGESHLEGNIVVTQPGRKMTADKATLYRDGESGEITKVLLLGNVHYYESGKQLIAQSVFLDLEKKHAELDDAIYRLARPTRRETLNAWGQAKHVERLSNNHIIMRQASYTTCSPVNQTWNVIAMKLDIDRDLGWGEAINTYLLIHDFPVLWVPYFSFPVDKRRKTGFLFPTFHYANSDGFHIKIPYYLNLAPNYDATLIPGYISRRGAEIETHFRYLTCHHNGNFNLHVIPYDALYAYFRKTAPQVYGGNINNIPYIDRIEDSSNTRGYLSYTDCANFNCHWSGRLDVNLVSDDYYLQDFAYNPYLSTTDQLLNQALLRYSSENWKFLGKLQTYQTLHPINQQPVLNQYSRLPQLFITSDYPEYPCRLTGQINSEFVYFDGSRNFVTGISPDSADRFHLSPSIVYPMITPYSFFKPRLQLDITHYDLEHESNEPSHIDRILPIFDIDSGLYLERNWRCFTQTLEPRIFYLYVPIKNQDEIPIFDTTLPPFSFSQLFRTNRFVGYDRVGDANQLSIALTSRFLQNCTGDQKLRISVGELVYFHAPEVCLTPNCQNDLYVNNTLSPIVGEINYMLSPAWYVQGDVAVASKDYLINNASIHLHYRPDCKHIFNIGYDFVRKGDTLTAYALDSSRNDLSRINLATAWQFTDRWQLLADWNYNLSHGHPEAYFYGFQYDSCCWALRIIASRIVTAENMNSQVTYQSNYYVQLQLKGLGNVGNSDPGRLLTTSIFGYQDLFKG